MEPDEYNYDRNNEAAKPLPNTWNIIRHTPRLSRMCDASKRQCHNAMIEYAESKYQEVSIGFLNWFLESSWTYLQENELGQSLFIEADWARMDESETCTEAELFLKYKQSLNEK